MKYYVIGEDKSMNEALTKDQINESIDNINENVDALNASVRKNSSAISNLQSKIASGSAAPSGGNNGDIYIQY